MVNRLAGSLATSIAAQLGITDDDAKQRLARVFTEALAPPDPPGPPKSNAERASALVARLRQIAELATRVAQGVSGEPIRSIIGTSLDADSAKAKPAPSTNDILREAFEALALPATAPVPALAAVTAPGPATPSDARTVANPALPAIASGGDTPLGRILTRAALVDAQRSPSTAPAVPAAASTADIAPAAAPRPSALEAFVHAFAAALGRDDAQPPAHHDGADSSSVSAALPAQPASPGPSVLPVAFSIAPEVTAIVPHVPAPAHVPSPQPVDANAIVDQVLRGISLRTSDGSSTLRLQLVPENLGDVSVKLVVTGGRVDASITAHSVEAQSALAGGHVQLARALSEAGLKLQSFSVGLAGGAFADARDHANQRSWTRSSSRRIDGVDLADVDESSETSLLAVPTFGPPIYTARPNQWGLEYLV